MSRELGLAGSSNDKVEMFSTDKSPTLTRIIMISNQLTISSQTECHRVFHIIAAGHISIKKFETLHHMQMTYSASGVMNDSPTQPLYVFVSTCSDKPVNFL